MRLTRLLAGLAILFVTAPAFAQGFGFTPVQPWDVCRAAIRTAERSTGGGIPDHLLAAIGRVESGRRNPQTGRSSPWPWTINAEGQGSFFATKAEAIAAVRDLQARGVRSIDVGCMQINLMHHPNAFGSLDQAFDPQANAAYAIRFLTQLFDQAGDWIAAAGLYHSATPELAADYRRQVLAVLPQERQEQTTGGDGPLTQLAAAWHSTLAPTPRGVSEPFGFAAAPPAGGRIIPLPTSGGGGQRGRGLDAYRAAPIALAARLFRSPGG